MTEEVDFRWLRLGWFDQGRPCDNAVKYLTEHIPGKRMPTRWKADSQEDFIEQFGEGVHWAKAASYHLLIINGVYVFRVWTNTERTIPVEVSDRLVPYLEDAEVTLQEIPKSSQERSKQSFKKRFKLTLIEELDYLINIVKVLYGLGNE